MTEEEGGKVREPQEGKQWRPGEEIVVAKRGCRRVPTQYRRPSLQTRVQNLARGLHSKASSPLAYSSAPGEEEWDSGNDNWRSGTLGQPSPGGAQ